MRSALCRLRPREATCSSWSAGRTGAAPSRKVRQGDSLLPPPSGPRRMVDVHPGWAGDLLYRIHGFRC